MMLTIHETVVGTQFLPIVIRGMRNSWESWEKSDSGIETVSCRKEIDGCIEWVDQFEFIIGTADLELALRLIKIGDDHGKYLRQIPVAFDITAPEFFWWEVDTYKIATVANSTSSMHTLGRGEITKEMLSCEDTDNEDIEEYLKVINKVRDKWIASGKKKATKEWRALVEISPRSLLFRRTYTCNYQTLRHMFHARRHHRLGEWKIFCEHIETLPYSILITVAR